MLAISKMRDAGKCRHVKSGNKCGVLPHLLYTVTLKRTFAAAASTKSESV